MEVRFRSLFVKLGKVIKHGVNYSENEKDGEDLSIILVIINVDCIDVYNEDCHVKEMEEASDHVDLESEFIPLEFNDINNSF